MFLPKSFVYYSCVGSCRNIWSQLVTIAHHRIEGTSGTPELRFTQSIRGPEGRSLRTMASSMLLASSTGKTGTHHLLTSVTMTQHGEP
eukprot:scaffold4569_cov104-Skeletonema_dohrnii-CCMP3373.AAC.1